VGDATTLLGAWLATGADEDGAWTEARQGPPLADVASRLSAIPSPFLDPAVDVVALARDAGIDGPLACAAHLENIEVRRGAAVAVWLLASEQLVAPLEPSLADGAPERLIDALALRLAPASDPMTWLADGERRDEAARVALLWSGYVPANESAQVARSHWDAVDSLRRNEALAKFTEEEQHRRAIAAKLAEASAREATARYNRE
jgi:hypothetical protein